MAILSGELEPSVQEQIIESLAKERNISRASAYFSFYVLDALRVTNHMGQLIDRLTPWFGLAGAGFKTTPEVFSGTVRSDCHAWSAHPIFHYLTAILGIRPGSMGFKTVEIRPQPGTLLTAKGCMVHPCGKIDVHFIKKAIPYGLR